MWSLYRLLPHPFLILVVFLGAATSAVWALTLPKPSGPYTVGYRHAELTDAGRKDPFDPTHERTLKLTLYYPSNDAYTQESYGMENVLFWTRALQEPLSSHDITAAEARSVIHDIAALNVYKTLNAGSAKGPFPVIIFEHGFGVTADSYHLLLQDLVSHGYIVIAPAHPFIADVVIFNNGTRAFLKAERDALAIDTVYADARFVLDQLGVLKKHLPQMDLSRVGMMGHSLGGIATMKMARGKGIKAAVQLDAPLGKDMEGLSLDSGSDFSIPFLHLFAADNPSGGRDTIHLGRNNEKVIIDRIDHNAFADHGLLKEIISVFVKKKWHLGAGHAIFSSYHPSITQLIRTFFDKFLGDKSFNNQAFQAK